VRRSRRSPDARAERLARIQAHVRRQARQIAAMAPVVEKFDAEFWKAVTERLNVRINRYRNDRAERFETMSEVELKVNVSKEVELQEVLELPETVKALLESMREEHAKARGELRNLQERSKL
jgi:hypothetical protein